MMRSRREVGRAAEAAVLLSGVAFALRVMPARVTGRVVRRACHDEPLRADTISSDEVDAVTLAIRRAARRVPASCLAQALVGWWMLRRRAGSSVVRLGVRGSPRAIAAHAWLERDGRILIGEEEAAEHARFPAPQ
jgi:hypothetical protein